MSWIAKNKFSVVVGSALWLAMAACGIWITDWRYWLLLATGLLCRYLPHDGEAA